MLDYFLHFETEFRLVLFVSSFLIIFLWELLATKRPSEFSVNRTLTNLFLMIINSLALRLVMPILVIELALQLEAQGFGILPQIPLPEFATFLISLVVLDLAIYIQHVIFHKVPFLWRFHQVHHADTGFDVTTGVRFHPGEIVFSMLFTYKASKICNSVFRYLCSIRSHICNESYRISLNIYSLI